MRERENEWTDLMRSANAGDTAAYHRLLKAVTPVLRAAARRGLARAGQPVDQSEDIVQDILFAVHLKRHTWDPNAPFAPWLFAIARNKLIDALRGLGEDFCNTVLGSLAARARRMVEGELKAGGKVNPKEVAAARRLIADMVLDLAEKGEIQLRDPPAAAAE